MPTPHEGESREDFVSRCIPIVLDDETAQDQDQAVAICNSMWREAVKEQDKMTDKMERKTFSSFVTKADEDQGIIETVFAVFGNIDKGLDIIHPGAFTKTFAERGAKVRVLDNHRTDTVMRAIGKPLMFKEVAREALPPELLAQHPEATGGAFASVQMLMDTPEGKGAFIRLKEGAIDEWSFGYDALDVDFSQAVQEGKEVNVRNLRTLKLYEISPVLFGMNEATTTVSAKAEGDAGILTPTDDVSEEDFETQVLEVLEKYGYAPVEKPQVASDNQNDDKAGPDDSPPTSSVLDEITLLEHDIKSLEASYEFEEQGTT
jgi:phage head maturation protease